MEIKNTSYNEQSNNLGASDIVNGTACLYSIREKEMETALKDLYKEIGYEEDQ